MAKVFLIQTNFLGGEIDPRLKGRVDIPRYQNGLETLTNAYALILGGATRMLGTRFVYDAGSVDVKLFPFVIFRTDVSPSVQQGYVIEFRSDNTIRFYTNGALITSGGNPYSIASPFPSSALKKIGYVQFNNTLYFVHPDFPPQQLLRTSDIAWQITTINFTQPSPPHWDATTGYPSVIAFFEQRILLGATKCEPQTIWGSQNGNILNLVTGVNDSDPFEFLISVATSNILHLTTGRQVIVLTYDKEITIQGGSEKPLTPTNVQIKEQTTYGVREFIKPLTIGGELLFVTRHGIKVRGFDYQVDTDKYTAPDRSFVAGHLTELGIEEMTKTQEPLSMLWIVTTDGKLLTCAFDKEQEVIAWSKNITDGLFKNVVSIPYNNTDQVWVAVQRTISGSTKTYIEYFDPLRNTNAAYVGYNANGATVWTGLSHLEGKVVDIIADGVVLAQQTVSSGQITLATPAYNVEIGLSYTTTITDLPVEIQTPVGTAQGQKISVNRITVRLYKSLGGEIGGQALLPTTGEPQSVDKMVQTLGWASAGVITIEQKKPLPFTVLAILKEVVINE